MTTIGVTLGIGKKYYQMAQHAARQFEKVLGIKTEIIDRAVSRRGFDSKYDAYMFTKLFLHDLFPQERLIYFDADWWLLRPWPKFVLETTDFVCVKDRWWSPWLSLDCHWHAINPQGYFNAGFFISTKQHRGMFDYAKEHYLRARNLFYDQTLLNVARAKLGIPTLWLDKRFNFVGFNPENAAHVEFDTIALHGALVKRALMEGGPWPETHGRIRVACEAMRRWDGKIIEHKRYNLLLYGDGTTNRDRLHWYLSSPKGKPKYYLVDG